MTVTDSPQASLMLAARVLHVAADLAEADTRNGLHNNLLRVHVGRVK